VAPYPGLTERETLVLRALRDLRHAPADELVRRSGVAQADLSAALDRLVGLGYAERREEGGTVYRPSSRAL
jgi:DNA-binding MarR family transcriptional regulator